MIICSTCGAQNLDGMNFCDQCGAQLPAPQPAGQAAAPVAQAYAPPAAAGITCSNCSHINPLGSGFCEECGTPLAAGGGGQAVVAPPPIQQPYQPVIPPPVIPSAAPTSLKFILPSGAQVPFPASPSNTWVIGREDPVSGIHPEIDLTPHDPEQTISRRHAQISLQSGQPVLTSLTSTNWTKLNGARIVVNQPQVIKAGDKIEFAKCAVTLGM